MPRCSATRRASYVVDRAAALPRRARRAELRQAALIPELHGKADDGRAGFASMAATTELSTPPLMATAVRRRLQRRIGRAALIEAWHRAGSAPGSARASGKLRAGARRPRESFPAPGDFLFGIGVAEAEAHAGARFGRREADGGEHVRRIHRAGGARRAGGAGQPCRSSAITSASLSTPGKCIFEVLGARGARGAIDARPGRDRAVLAPSGRAARRRARRLRPDARAPVQRPCPSPTMPATFSVPARRPRSLCPP